VQSPGIYCFGLASALSSTTLSERTNTKNIRRLEDTIVFRYAYEAEYEKEEEEEEEGANCGQGGEGRREEAVRVAGPRFTESSTPKSSTIDANFLLFLYISRNRVSIAIRFARTEILSESKGRY